MPQTKLPLRIRGYLKPEGDHYVSVCIDLNLVTEGDTDKEAMEAMVDAIKIYLSYISDQPEEFNKRIPRKAPLEFRFTYHLIKLTVRISKFIHWWKEYSLFERKLYPVKIRLV